MADESIARRSNLVCDEADEHLGRRGVGDSGGNGDDVGNRCGGADGHGHSTSVFLAAGLPLDEVGGPFVSVVHITGQVGIERVLEAENAGVGGDLRQARGRGVRCGAEHVFDEIGDSVIVSIPGGVGVGTWSKGEPAHPRVEVFRRW